MQNRRGDNLVEVSIILATYNESENLPLLVKKIHENAIFDFQIIFVDDGSSDGTREFILDYIANHPISKYIFNDGKQSILKAHCQGIEACDGEFVIIMDADLQHPPEKIREIYSNLKSGYIAVSGSRYMKEASPGARSPLRGVISRTATLLAKLILRSARNLSDPLSGFFGMKREIFKPFNNGWRGYESFLFILASNPNLKLIEIPYVFGERRNGESKIVKGTDFVRVFLTELVLARRLEISSSQSKSIPAFAAAHSKEMSSGINEQNSLRSGLRNDE